MRTRLYGFVCCILVTLLFPAAKTSAQTNTNCLLVMTCPSNIVVTSCFNVQEFYTPTASNICCGVNSSVTCTPPSGSIFAVGTTTTVTCTATDCDQNTNFCTFTVTVLQGTNCATNCLEIQCPSNIVVTSCTNIQEFYAPTVTDTCCSNWTVVCSPPSGSYFAPNTTNLIDCFVTDFCGMSNSCSFTLTVLRGANCPTNCLQITCPTNKTVQCGSNWSFDLPTATSCCTNEYGGSTGPGTNVLITPISTMTNGGCPQPITVTQTWSITDLCGDSNTCSQTVTVTGCCTNTNCITLTCPSNIVVTTCSNCVPVFYAATAANTCCFSNVVLNYSLPSGYCFPLGTTTVTVTAHDPDCASTPPAMCSFTVTVNQGTNCCSGPGMGLQSIQWLQLPTNTTRLLPNPTGANGGGTWIITNLPGYGNVLVVQDAPTNVIARCTNSDFGRIHAGGSFDNPPTSYGYFDFTETGYGPYTWGVLPGSVELAYGFPYTLSNNLPAYQVSFYFLDGQPNPGSLVFATIGLSKFTTNTLSQPFTFRTEYDLLYDPVNYPQGPSADTVLDGTYGPPLIPGVTGTVISSAYVYNGGDDYNTGYAILQPTNYLLTANLPSGSGYDVNLNPYPSSVTNPCPYLTITVNHYIYDIFSTTVGYLCCTNCPTNCLQIQGSTNKTVQCGSNWMFDPPTATSCCTNEFVTGPATETNVLITAINTVTNGVCPEPMQITQTWSIVDGCGDSNTWSQTVTVLGCCTNCLIVNCPTNKTVACDSGWSFDTPTATTCCSNQIDTEQGVTNVLITPVSTVTNGSCPNPITVTQTWSIVDACGNSNSCSQIVTLTNCCSSPCVQVECPSNIVVTTCSNCVPVYYTANATVNGFCCTNISAIVYDPPPGTCFNLGVSNVTVSVYACGFVTNCGFTVTVLVDTNCCTNTVTNINLNTGYDPNSNNVYSYGQADATWWVTKDPTLPPTTVPRPATVVDPNAAWFAAQPNSGWISSYATDADTLNGEYDFQTYFCTAADATNLALSICLRADDVAAAALNGHLITLSPSDTAFNAPVPACGTAVNPSWFIYGGENVLTVYVTNLYGVAMGLNAEVSVSGSGLLPVGSPCCPLGSGISGQKFDDMNCNGIQDPSEPGLSGWTIQLSYGTNIVTNVTDVNGYYYFTNLPPGTYTVTEVQQVGWSQSAPVGGSYTVTLTNLQQLNNLNFGNCNTNIPTNCINLTCPSNIVVTTCSNCAQVFYSASASDFCCNPGPAGAPVTLTYNPPSGTCFEPGVTTVQVTAIDECQNVATCSFTVTVLNGTNCCCGTNVGPRAIQWLQCPAANSTPLLADPSGTNTSGMWIITNLPCYGNVLVTQTFPDNSPDLVYWFLNPNLENVPAAYGSFADVEAGYGPYSWGTYGSTVDFYNGQTNGSYIHYNLNFYFLSNAPNPCALYLGVIGLGANTTATVSQPVVFRAEYDLAANAPGGNGSASANTMLNGVFGPSVAGATGTIVGSAYNTNGAGDPVNTGWAVLQPTYAVNTVSLPGGSGTDVNGNTYPAAGTYSCLTLTVSQQPGDGIALTVGYVCCCTNCSTNSCLEIECPTNKTVQCGTEWNFDAPAATSCCTSNFSGTSTNLLITPISTVTNGVCPQIITVTRTWSIVDACGESNSCSQVVTLAGCCTNCLQINCPTNKTVQCGTQWNFNAPTATSCCATNFSGIGTNVLITPISTVTNGVCPQVITVTRTWSIVDACGESNTCSQVVTLAGCCTNCLQIDCPTNRTAQCGSTWAFNTPTATSCCATNFPGTGTNVMITVTSTVTNGVCPQVITRNWRITDACGDSNNCSQTITVVDTTPPVINCPTNIVVVLLNSNCQMVIPYISVTATDNCTPVCSLVYSQSPTNGTLVSGTNVTVTVTVTDLCGNSNSCHVLVVGTDKTAPTLTCPATMTVTNCTVPCVPVTATDNCCPQAPTVTQSPACGTPIGPGINSVTVTATDCHGNTTTRIVHLIITGPASFLSNLTNTGVGTGGVLLADNTVDLNYLLPVAAVPAGMPADYQGNAVAVSDICHSSGNGCAWLNTYVHSTCYEYVPWNLAPDPAINPSALSKWIAPDYTNNGCCPTGNFTYTLNFTLPAGFNPATATISGRWAADNQASMELNGVPVAGATPYISAWTPFTIPAGSGFVTGANTLKFIVNNYGSWTGLRIEFTNAYANCSTCVPPVINWITPAQSLQAGSTATFNVSAGGTPPFSYQWFHNNASLAGSTNSTLQIHSINYSNAGLYTVIVSNPCGVVTGYVRLTVTQPWWWTWGWWNVQTLTNALAATTGPDLNLAGSSFATNYGITAGTTEDFGLPAQGGQIVNVMHINPQAGASIEVPPITESSSNTDNSYTLIMDLYEPDTSLGTPSTLFQSIACCVSNLGSGGQDGVGLTLDASNILHITGSVGGMAFDGASAQPLPVDAWNRVALVVDNPQDGSTVSISGFINGNNVIVINPCICCVLPFPGPSINWNISSPIIFSAPTNALAPNGDFFVSSVQFHAIALTPQMVAGIGSPDNGPAPANSTAVSLPPVLSTSVSNGVVSLTWSGSAYVLQESADLTSGVWVNSTLPFTESQPGSVETTATVTPAPSAPSKFYRLIFSP